MWWLPLTWSMATSTASIIQASLAHERAGQSMRELLSPSSSMDCRVPHGHEASSSEHLHDDCERLVVLLTSDQASALHQAAAGAPWHLKKMHEQPEDNS